MERRLLDEKLWEMRVPMLRLAWSILRHASDAEDTVSAAMVQAYAKIHTLRSEDALKPWLMRITANACYDLLRKQKREARWVSDAQHSSALFASPQEETLLDIISLLPGPMAQVLTLYYYDCFTTGEISRILGIPGATVRMRLSRGRRQLAQLIQKGESEDEQAQL